MKLLWMMMIISYKGIRVDEKDCTYLKVYFGDVAREAEEASDVNSGDDIWDEDIIPDSLSSDDDEEAVVCKEMRANTDNNEELLFLKKTFDSEAAFKVALLMYSIQT